MTASVPVRTYSLYFDFLNSKNLDDTFDRLFTDGFVTSNYRDNDGGNGGGNDVEFCDRQQKQANEGKSSPSSHDDIVDAINNPTVAPSYSDSALEPSHPNGPFEMNMSINSVFGSIEYE